MRTRVHAHSGPEAFYVVSGVQCVETPTQHRMIRAGETFVVPEGPHFQSSPTGRRSLVLVIHSAAEPWMTPRTDWAPGAFCNG
jgi:mannose-6-phosphate isomerase-like protein (cupin superfamily)